MTDIPFAIGEEFSSKWQFLPYIERDIHQFNRIDLCNVGGFTEAMKVAGWSEAHYVDLMPHNPLGPVCTAATVHLAAAVRELLLARMPLLAGREASRLRFDAEFFPVQPRLEGAHYVVPDAAGPRRRGRRGARHARGVQVLGGTAFASPGRLLHELVGGASWRGEQGAEAPARGGGFERPVGILMALAANFLFTTSDAVVKTLTARYPVVQVITMQVGFAFIPLLAMSLRDGTFTHLRIVHPVLVGLRGLLAGFGTLCGFFAFSRLPLADVYSIAFCAPIVVTIASIPILGERVGPYRVAAVMAGFCGILIMVQPGVVPLSLGHAAAFGNVFVGAATVLIMRRIGREEQRGVMVAAVLIGLLLVSLPGTLIVGRRPAPGDIALAAVSGLIMGCAQFLVLEALRRAPSRASRRCSTRCSSGR